MPGPWRGGWKQKAWLSKRARVRTACSTVFPFLMYVSDALEFPQLVAAAKGTTL